MCDYDLKCINMFGRVRDNDLGNLQLAIIFSTKTYFFFIRIFIFQFYISMVCQLGRVCRIWPFRVTNAIKPNQSTNQSTTTLTVSQTPPPTIIH